MEFNWDEENIAHIARHNVKPEEAEEVFYNNPFEAGTQFRNGEEREIIIGPTFSGRMLFLSWTDRHGRIRVVTAYKAAKEHIAIYFENLG